MLTSSQPIKHPKFTFTHTRVNKNNLFTANKAIKTWVVKHVMLLHDLLLLAAQITGCKIIEERESIEMHFMIQQRDNHNFYRCNKQLL